MAGLWIVLAITIGFAILLDVLHNYIAYKAARSSRVRWLRSLTRRLGNRTKVDKLPRALQMLRAWSTSARNKLDGKQLQGGGGGTGGGRGGDLAPNGTANSGTLPRRSCSPRSSSELGKGDLSEGEKSQGDLSQGRSAESAMEAAAAEAVRAYDAAKALERAQGQTQAQAQAQPRARASFANAGDLGGRGQDYPLSHISDGGEEGDVDAELVLEGLQRLQAEQERLAAQIQGLLRRRHSRA